MATSVKKKAATPAKKGTAKKEVGDKRAVLASGWDIYGALEQYFGFREFKGTQHQAIESLLSGRDTFVIMPTGGGKSLCYQLPALICNGTAIIVSPLIALMKNQVDSIRNVSDSEGVAHFLNSSLKLFI